jgi:DNA-binding NtrC family response regulator
MTIRYDALVLRKAEASPEVLVLLMLLAELYGFALVDTATNLDRAQASDAATPPVRVPEAREVWVPSAGEGSQPLPLEQVHDLHVQRVLDICGGNRAHAAQMLGISRNSLYRTLRRLGLVRRNRKKFPGQAGNVAAPVGVQMFTKKAIPPS